jgi:hypothetical protein
MAREQTLALVAVCTVTRRDLGGTDRTVERVEQGCDESGGASGGRCTSSSTRSASPPTSAPVARRLLCPGARGPRSGSIHPPANAPFRAGTALRWAFTLRPVSAAASRASEADLVGVAVGRVRPGRLVALARAGKIERDAAELLALGRQLERPAGVVGRRVGDQQERLALPLHLVVDREPIHLSPPGRRGPPPRDSRELEDRFGRG